MSARLLPLVGAVLLLGASTCVRPTSLAPAAPAAPSSASSSAPSPASLPASVPLGAWRMPERAACAGSYAPPTTQGALGDERLLEASGIVPSPAQPGVLWLHNDSGDEARVYAVGTDGRALGALTLPNVDAVDVEDMAAAPCPDLSGPCLYLADTGDNRLRREQLVVYAVPEPPVGPDRPLAANSTAPFVWIFPIVVPERANIEALVVLPDLSAMVLYEKTEGERARVFRYGAPWTPLSPATVEVSGTVAVPATLGPLRQITGADLHPSGTKLLLRGYGAVWELALDAAAGVSAAHLDGATLMEVLSTHDEPQGEAVAYDEAGTGIWTVSESPSGVPGPPLRLAACAATP
ncbi:MAG: hypothetical protein IT383_19605 [Deltaproteobacteria bacterium]|nr:hypothetical protein [Deltaproteobacteria bacterium]